MIAHSFSRIELFSKCPFAYKRYCENSPRSENNALILGGAVHEFIAVYISYLITKNRETDIDQGCKSTTSQSPLLPEEIRSDFKTICDNFINSFILDENEKSNLKLERKFSYDDKWQPVDWFDKSTKFRAVVDYIRYDETTKTAYIRDWKTNHSIAPMDEDSLQLKIYAFIAGIEFPDVEKIETELSYVRFGRSQKHEFWAYELAGIKTEIEQFMQVIEGCKKFEPRASSFCSWCSYTKLCPLFNGAVKNVAAEMIESREQAEQLAAELRFLELREKQVDGLLRNYVDANGAINAGDETLKFVPVEKTSLQAEPVVAELLGLGADREKVWAALSLSKTKAQSTIKSLFPKGKWKEPWAEIEEKHGVKKLETHFKFVKEGEVAAEESESAA